MADVVWFKDVDKNDLKLVGGKGANLGELYKAEIPVPNGFIITADAYFASIKSSGVLDRIRGLLFNLNVDNPLSLQHCAVGCQEEIKKIKLDNQLETKIAGFYRKLSGAKDAYVAVRSSATAEDLPEASFAGQQSTFLNVKGKKNLIQAILACWASLFEARAIFYRVQKNFDHFKVGIAVPIQKMVQSEISGVMFTVDPVTSYKNLIIIEAVWGLGELIVGGQATPDHYEIDKRSFQIRIKSIVVQPKQLVGIGSQNKLINVSRPYRRQQKLPDEKIIELAKIGATIEKHYFFPQDIEWAYENKTLYIVQTRPVTTFKEKPQLPKEKDSALIPALPAGRLNPSTIILQGAPASPAIASGKVVIIHSPKELFKVQKGDVLVTEMTNPDFVPAMRKAVAIVTDLGGRTSHAAIVSREMGIACVVGTNNATKKLKNGQIVTVDGAHGIVHKGNLLAQKGKIIEGSIKDRKLHKKTATRLYVNLAEPDLAAKIAAKNIDGVGLLRAEFILAQIGKHPKMFLEERKGHEFVNALAKNLTIFARAFGLRPVIYRATDLKSNEYRNLAGGEKYEPHESNPMLGYRGAFRYIKDPDVFKLELEAVAKVRASHQNLHLMIPYVRTVEELQNVKELVAESGLLNDSKFKFWMMCEIPANFILLEDFIAVGIDGISIGSNDLTMLILGTDRDNEEVASQFDEMNEAVLTSLEKIVKTCLANNVTCSICGQAPSTYPALTEKLVNWGITSISVNPDAIEITREMIYQAEHKLVNSS